MAILSTAAEIYSKGNDEGVRKPPLPGPLKYATYLPPEAVGKRGVGNLGEILV